jgi:hypothetical protein
VYYRRAVFCCAFLWAKGLNVKDIHREIFSVYVGKCLSHKVVPPLWQTFRWWQGWNRDTKVAETTIEGLLSFGFQRTGKGLGQVYQCWWRIYVELIAFPSSNITYFMFCSHLWPIYCLFLVLIYFCIFLPAYI